MTVADSLVYPKESDASYPYTDVGKREFLEDKEFLETFTLTAAMGAVTSRIRFTPFRAQASGATTGAGRQAGRVDRAPDRQPARARRRPESWPEDFTVTGVPWKARGKRMDEELDVLLDKLAKLRAAEGVAARPFEIHAISHDAYTPRRRQTP